MFSLSNSTVPNRIWISSEDALAVAERGFRIVHAPSNYFYLVSCLVLPVVITSLTDHPRIVVLVNG